VKKGTKAEKKGKLKVKVKMLLTVHGGMKAVILAPISTRA